METHSIDFILMLNVRQSGPYLTYCNKIMHYPEDKADMILINQSISLTNVALSESLCENCEKGYSDVIQQDKEKQE